MHPYADHICDRLTQALMLWSDEARADIYVLSLHVTDSVSSWDDEDRLISMQSVIGLSFNTGAYLETLTEGSAKWDGTDWHGNGLVKIPRVPFKQKPNTNELALRDAWCHSVGLVPAGQDDAGVQQYPDEKLYRATCDLCGQAVRQLHESGTITKLFGRPIPILMRDTDSRIDMAITEPANPPETLREVREFLLTKAGNWMASKEWLKSAQGG